MANECGSYIELAGKVFSGLGEGEFYVNLYARNFHRVLGIRPYPGTLNIRLDDNSVTIAEKCLRKDKAILIDPPLEGYGRVCVWPAYLKCLKVYVIRPEKTVYKRDVVELISDKNLREVFNLVDGDRVKVQVALDNNWMPPYCI